MQPRFFWGKFLFPAILPAPPPPHLLTKGINYLLHPALLQRLAPNTL